MYLIGFGDKSGTAKGLLDKYFQGVERVDILESVGQLDIINASGNEYDRVVIYSKLLEGLNDTDYTKVINDLKLSSYSKSLVVFYCTDKDIALALQDEVWLYRDRMVVLYNGEKGKFSASSLLKLFRDDISVLSQLYSLDGLEGNRSVSMLDNVGLGNYTDNSGVVGVLGSVEDIELDSVEETEITEEFNTLSDLIGNTELELDLGSESNIVNDIEVDDSIGIGDWVCEATNNYEVEEPVKTNEDSDIYLDTSNCENILEPKELEVETDDVGIEDGIGIEEYEEVSDNIDDLLDTWGSEVEDVGIPMDIDLDEGDWNSKVSIQDGIEIDSIAEDWNDTNNSCLEFSSLNVSQNNVEVTNCVDTTINNEPKKKGLFRGKKEINFKSKAKTTTTKVDINKLKVLLDSYGRKGCSISFIGNNSGNTTVVDNISTITSSLGFSTLVVDLNLLNRGLASITRDNYLAVHNAYTDNSSLRQGLNSSLGNLSSIANISKVDYHLLTSGLASQYIKHNEVTEYNKLNKFITNSKSMYNYVIYDIPLEHISNYAPVIYTSDIVVITSRLSNKGLYDKLLRMCNIDNDDVEDILFTRGKVIYTFDKGVNTLLGSKYTINNLGYLLDDKVKELLDGEDLDYKFSNLDVVGSIRYSDIYDAYWGGNSVVTNKDYMNEYLIILENLLS